MYFSNLFGNFSNNRKNDSNADIPIQSKSSSNYSNKGSYGDSSKSITGSFDPTSLERGAKALREIDSSPNASKAFELTKLQEITRQKELQNDLERMQLQKQHYLSERIRKEAEEKRKNITHQQEQERITSQYRAQLEKETHMKKIEEQNIQNKKYLDQQHNQFLRQEEIRKANEKYLMDLKTKKLEEEKAMEKELIKIRVHEEAKAKILQERENVDIHLKNIRTRAEEERQTRIKTVETAFSSVGNGLKHLLEDKQKIRRIIEGFTALAFGIYATKAGVNLTARYLERRLGKPSLISETSKWTFRPRWPTFFWPWKRKVNFQQSLFLPQELSQRLEWTTNSLLTAKKMKRPNQHLLLYGPPGTGKTLFGKTLAKQANMDYAIMSGGDVAPLGSDAIHEIHKVFEWAKKSKKGLILFVDEAESFLSKGRQQLDGNMSENVRQALSAVLDRIDEQFEFPLPPEEERFKMLNFFFEKYLTKPENKAQPIILHSDIDENFMRHIAKVTEGFSGRELSKLVISFCNAVYGAGVNVLTKGLAETVLKWKLLHRDDSPKKIAMDA